MKQIIIILIFLSTFVYANIAKITTFEGDVDILRAEQILKASKGFELLEKDTIKTTSEGRVQLLFTDNTIISVGYNSTFSIDEYVNEVNKPPKVQFGLKKGIFKSITGKIGNLNPNRFKLKTKSASIGIRGTTVLANVGDDNEKIICTDGGIRVENEFGFSDVDAGEMTTVITGTAPSAAVFAPANEVDQMENQSGATQNEKESGIDQKSADNAKNKRENTQNTNQQNRQNLNAQNKQGPPQPNTGYKYELEGNSNLSQNIYYKFSLTNKYNQGTNTYKSGQAQRVIGTVDNALSVTDGSFGDYLSWGHWEDSDEIKNDTSLTDYTGRSHWISGVFTPANDVPKSGSATYTGTIAGSTTQQANTALAGSTVNGTTSITANFGSNTMSGSFNVTGTDFSVNSTLSGVEMTRGQSGVTFKGNLVGGSVNSGSIDGAFFGNNAQAVGGIWEIKDTSSNVANGTFSATK